MDQATKPNLLDPEERKRYLDESPNLRERISRGLEVPKFYAALGYDYFSLHQPMAEAGFPTAGFTIVTSDYPAWVQLEKGVKFGMQTAAFSTQKGRRRVYTLRIEPDLTVRWTCRNAGRWGSLAQRAVAEGDSIESMIEHARANPRELPDHLKRVYQRVRDSDEDALASND